MNKQTVEGKFDQAAGKVKQTVGEAIGNEKLANAGVADQVKGVAKETWGKTKDAAKEVSETQQANAGVQKESLKERAEAEAHEVREKITTSAQNLKNRINEKLDYIRNS